MQLYQLHNKRTTKPFKPQTHNNTSTTQPTTPNQTCNKTPQLKNAFLYVEMQPAMFGKCSVCVQLPPFLLQVLCFAEEFYVSQIVNSLSDTHSKPSFWRRGGIFGFTLCPLRPLFCSVSCFVCVFICQIRLCSRNVFFTPLQNTNRVCNFCKNPNVSFNRVWGALTKNTSFFLRVCLVSRSLLAS